MKTQYTDAQLKQALATMLPDVVKYFSNNHELWWKYPHEQGIVRDTALLHLCWLVEETLDDEHTLDYVRTLLEDVLRCFPGKSRQYYALTHASWQQRTTALAKVNGVEIV